jgi:hypothetical protein
MTEVEGLAKLVDARSICCSGSFKASEKNDCMTGPPSVWKLVEQHEDGTLVGKSF